jgi:hypothetical protein
MADTIGRSVSEDQTVGTLPIFVYMHEIIYKELQYKQTVTLSISAMGLAG